MAPPQTPQPSLPRVAITYCTQCRWMLRAAYFAQELLSTFGTQIGEIALVPATGGLFRVELTYKPETDGENVDIDTKQVLLWDRKAEGGFPETKVLKQLVRDHIDPKRDLGHSDRHGKKKEGEEKSEAQSEAQEAKPASAAKVQGETTEIPTRGPILRNTEGKICEDCS